MKKAPRHGGAGAEYIKALNKLYSTPRQNNSVPTPANRQVCRGCGIHIRSFRSGHLICQKCLCWHEALSGIITAREAIKEVW